MRKYIGIMILAVCYGCGVSKERNSGQTTKVKRAILQTDQVTRQQVAIGQGNRKLIIRHVEWLPPDSTGVQPVKSVTHVSTTEEQKEETITTEACRSDEITTEKAVLRKEESRRARWSNRIIPWGIIGCLMVLFFIIRKRTR